MNIAFIIGNGFDLQNNLKTSFFDFFEYVSNEGLLDDSNYIYRIYKKESNTAKGDEWSNFEEKLGELTFDIPEKIDVDKFISDLLKFRNDFIDYMIRQQEIYSIGDEEAEKSIYTTLENFYDKLKDNEKSIIKNKLNSVSKVNVYFINFNYTNTLDILLNKVSKEIRIGNNRFVIHKPISVHRTLTDGTFLGVDNETQLNAKVFNKIQLNGLIKPNSIENYESDDVKQAKSILKSSSIMFIFGMSLGRTDESWWKIIAEGIQKTHEKRYLIINEYKDDEKKHPFLYLNNIDSVKANFLQHLDNDSSNNLSEKIFISFMANNILRNNRSD